LECQRANPLANISIGYLISSGNSPQGYSISSTILTTKGGYWQVPPPLIPEILKRNAPISIDKGIIFAIVSEDLNSNI
jgi:hypothetical protein